MDHQAVLQKEETDALKLKNDILSPHIPFIQQMIVNFTDTEFEEKWKTMLKCVESNKKRMTIEQIHKLDATLTKRRADAERFKKENDLKAKVKAPKVEAKRVMPKLANLGQPALTSDDLKALIDDLSVPAPVQPPTKPDPKVNPSSTASVQEPPTKVPRVEPKVEPKPRNKLPLKANILPRQTMIRLPSSFSPKIGAPRKIKNDSEMSSILSSAGIASPTLSPFRIPKKSPSFTPSLTSLAVNTKPESGSPARKLQSFKLFQGYNNSSEAKNKLTSPCKWDTVVDSTSLESKKPTIEKFTIVRSPSSEKKNIFTIQKTTQVKFQEPEEFLAEMESSFEDKVQQSTDIKIETEASSEKSEIEAQLPKEKVKAQMSKQQEEREPPPRRKSMYNPHQRMTKELSRLYEDIVKTDEPLPSRRSCTRKRTQSASLDSSGDTNDTSLDDQVKPAVKRVKESPKATQSPTVDKPSSAKKISVSKTPKSKESTPKVPEKLPEITPVRTTRNSVKLAEELPKVSPARPTRKSVQAAAKTAELPPSVELHSEPLKSVEKVATDFELKPCSIDLSKVVVDEPIEVPVTSKQTARKSTSKDSQTLHTRLNEMRKNRTKNGQNMRQTRATAASNKNEDDDEWEDIDESVSAGEAAENQSGNEEYESEPEEPLPIEPYIYKNICNIAFTHCKSGTIYKCLVQGCRSQTLQKNKFINHLERHHKNTKWSGFCNACGKLTGPSKLGLSIIMEFFHMMEEHLLKEKVLAKDIPEASLTPEHDTDSSEKASEPENATEMIEGIDLILNELSTPEEKGADKFDEKKVVAKTVATEKPQAFQIPATTAITLSKTIKPSASAGSVQTKVIAKNIVGRVISLKGLNNFVRIAPKPAQVTKPDASKPAQVTKPDASKPAQVTKPGAPKNVINSKPITKVVEQVPQPVAKLPQVIESPQNEITTDLDRIIKTFVCRKNIASPSHKVMYPLQVFSQDAERAVGSGVGSKKTSKLQQQMIEAQSKTIEINNITVTQMAPVNTQPKQFLDRLRPWLMVGTAKDSSSLNKMTTAMALCVTFKCLGRNCTFYTTSCQLFRCHLELHELHTPNDKLDYMSCSYCAFIAGNKESLGNHIIQAHCHDKYQCAYCFYRSCSEFNVVNHQCNFHKMRPRLVYVLESKLPINFFTELEEVKKSRSKFVSPLTCPICGERFFVFKTFLKHISEHTVAWSSKCGKCGERTTKGTIQKHMTQCYGLGLYQCVYCRYGTNTFEAIGNHLAISHPTLLPFLCERSEILEAKNPEPGQILPVSSSIERTCLKIVDQKLRPEIFRKASQPRHEEIALMNGVENIGKLNNSIQLYRDIRGVWHRQRTREVSNQVFSTLPNGTRLRIKPAPTCTIVTNPEPNQLQISNVFSLATPNEYDFKASLKPLQ